MIGKCPICSSELKVTKLECDKCHTTIEGKFQIDKFSKLTDDEKYFIEIFIKNRGNIKEIEKDMGVSYPTVRKFLDEVIEALGYKSDSKESMVDKKEVIRKLESGEISKEEALELIENGR